MLMRKSFYLLRKNGAVLVLMLMLGLSGNAAPLRFMPYEIIQPDGTKIACFVSGDEYHSWVHDANGYTIIRHPSTGYWVYASEQQGELVATDLVVGKAKPSTVKGLEPFANISAAKYRALRKRKLVENRFFSLTPTKGPDGIKSMVGIKGQTMNNVVIFIRFSDQTSIPDEPIHYYDSVYNWSVSSVADYYTKVSYGNLTVHSSFYPAPQNNLVVWYTDSHPRNYYQPYNAVSNPDGYDKAAAYNDPKSSTYREHTLLRTAIEAVSASIPADINLDINADGYVDVVSFVIAGSNDAWNDLLWPHQWSLWSQSARINGKKVGDYTLQLQYFHQSKLNLSTLCHEMFHAVGAPDLYHYDRESTYSPVGYWDVMARTADYPQNMGAYMKYRYGGWIDRLPEITASGTYTLSPLATSSTGNVYKIPSPKNHMDYFLVEYRNTDSYDQMLPGQGLIVYRINSRVEGIGNADGPPDELYIYRPDGYLTQDGSLQQAFFNATVGRTAISDATNPSSFLPDGSAGGLDISNISAPGATISFDVTLPDYQWVVMKNDKGYGSAIGNTSATVTVASRFTAEDLTEHVGKAIRMVDYFIRGKSGSDVTTNETVKIWEGGSFGNPGTLVYQKDVSAEMVIDKWSTHIVETPVEIKSGKEYWVGYSAKASSGYPFATDKGPMVDGKGGWINSGSSWKQLKEVNSNLDYNFLVRAVLGDNVTGDAAQLSLTNEVTMSISPNPVQSAAFVHLQIPVKGDAVAGIFNAMGQQVDRMDKVTLSEGSHRFALTRKSLRPGVYIYSLTFTTKGRTVRKTKRFVVL